MRPIGVSGLLVMLLGFPALGQAADTPAATTATFTKDVAPIFYKSCVECHRPTMFAPMSLMTYEDARPWARSIKQRVVGRVMPPWGADPAHGTFKNDPRLSQSEIDTIAAWADAGAPKGDDRDLPAPPRFAGGWTIGKPDVVFTMTEDFNVPASGTVPYTYVKIPTNLTDDRWVQAIEIKPGSRAHSDIVLQMHYTTNGTADTDRTSIAVIFAKEPPKKLAAGGMALSLRFMIPAGADNHEVAASQTFTTDTYLTSMTPHMHVRGKDMTDIAHYPDGTSETLLSVPKYDFSWQLTYELPKPKLMPKGTRLEVIAHFDNSTNNKFNPDPTKNVRWGDQTWEEMMIGFYATVVDPPSTAQQR